MAKYLQTVFRWAVVVGAYVAAYVYVAYRVARSFLQPRART